MKIREKRPDWAICWPADNSDDFCGITRLSLTGQKFLVGIHLDRSAPVRLCIAEKDGLKESFFCRLQWCSFGRWRGWLPFGHHNFEIWVACTTAPKTGQRIYRVHFTPGHYEHHKEVQTK
jgi:hypothetical protein